MVDYRYLGKGSFNSVAITNASSPYTALIGTRMIRADATSGAITITLPTAVGFEGFEFTIKRTDIIASSNLIKITTTSSQTIDGAADHYLWPAEFVELTSDGANWFVSKRSQPTTQNYFMLKGSTANRRYPAGNIFNSNPTPSTTFPAANLLWALPFIVPKTTKFDTISFNVTTGAAINARAGIYRDTGNCYPGALIFDTGAIDCTATGAKDTTITAGLQTFPPGLYWLAWECASNTIQVHTVGVNCYNPINGISSTSNSYGYTVAHTFGALPDPYTASATLISGNITATNPIALVYLRPI